MAKKKGKGKEQRAKTPYGRAKLDYRAVYGRDKPNFDINEQEFRFKAIRPDKGNAWIDRMVTDCSWSEDGGRSFNNPVTMTGALSIHKPVEGFTLGQGHQIDCYVRWPGHRGRSEGGIKERGWIRLWRMRIKKASFEVMSGAWQFDLGDDTGLLYSSTDDWKFSKTKTGKHKDGWRLNEIVQTVAREYRFKAKCPRGRVLTKKKTFNNANPMAVIQWAVEHEANQTGNQYIIRWEDGRLKIELARRNPLLYTFGDLLQSAEVSRAVRGNIASAMKVKWVEKKKGKGKKKAKGKSRYVAVRNQKLQRRYGYIHKEVTAPDRISSRGEAVNWAKGRMRRSAVAWPTVSFTHPGIAMVRRGDAIRLALPEAGFQGIAKGKTGLAFVQSVEHSLSSGDYTMTVGLTFRDMMDPVHLKRLKDKALRAKKKREKEAAKKRREAAKKDED